MDGVRLKPNKRQWETSHAVGTSVQLCPRAPMEPGNINLSSPSISVASRGLKYFTTVKKIMATGGA